MYDSLWDAALRVFGRRKEDTGGDTIRNAIAAEKYTDTKKTNFTAIFAQNLATKTVLDSDISITGNNKRAEFLGEISKSLWKESKKLVAMALGTGGAVIAPYVSNGYLDYSIIPQDRIYINSCRGDRLTNILVLADVADINHTRYYRWTNYALDSGVVSIKNKVTNSGGQPADIEHWRNIPDISITGVDRLPLAFLKSPANNRRSDNRYGVEITYGCDDIIKKILICLDQISDEFGLKQPRLIADDRFFEKDKKTGKLKLTSKLFMAFKNVNNQKPFEIFDPAIRESSFHAELHSLYNQLEKAVGVSDGVLTKREKIGTTATEIRADQLDTYAIIDSIRTALEIVWEDFIYACNVLCNAYSLCPPGEYDIKFDWSYSWLESSEQTFRQMKELQSIGAMSKAELRSWQTGEDIETAEQKIEVIKQNEPNYDTLIGG